MIGRSAFELFMTPSRARSRAATSRDFSRATIRSRSSITVNGPRLFQFRNKFVQSGSGVDEQFLICSGIDITEERSKRLIGSRTPTC